MWRKLCLIIIMVGSSYTELSGDHICAFEERYAVNVTEYFIRNLTVRNYKWCLNVPPRCSFYTVRQINDSRIVEKNETKKLEQCCPGFKEDNGKCVANCKKCVNGLCADGKCLCLAGYSGESCEEGCDSKHWGINCLYRCTCERGTCNPETGNCDCPAGWNGVRCEESCPKGFYSFNCKEKCDCPYQLPCNPVTGLCPEPTTITSIPSTYFAEYSTINDIFRLTASTIRSIHDPDLRTNPRLKLYELFSAETTSSTSVSLSTEATVFEQSPTSTNIALTSSQSPTSEITSTDHPDSSSTVLTHTNNGKFAINDNILKNDLKKDESTRSPKLSKSSVLGEEKEDRIALTDLVDNFSSRSSELSIALSENDDFDDQTLSQYGKGRNVDNKLDKIKVITEGDKLSAMSNMIQHENYLNDEGVDGSSQQNGDDSSMVSTISVSVAIAILLIIVALVTVTANQYRKSKKTKVGAAGDQRNGNVPTVAFVAHSIFHTPLPDPPQTKIPVFTSPIENNASSPTEATTFETRVVCSMNFSSLNGKVPDPREYLYDHPPSTGSYRAASIPEPPDSDVNSIPSGLQMEPVYDEIPPNRGLVPVSPPCPLDDLSSSLYMNTCGKTKF